MTQARGSEPRRTRIGRQEKDGRPKETIGPETSARGQPAPVRDEGSLPKMVAVRPLKELVLSRFPENHPLRHVILAEKDFIMAEEFLAKMEVWAVLVSRRT